MTYAPPPLDMSDPKIIQQLVETIDADFEDASVKMFDDGFRKHLGASVIGKACSREIWYGFRWARASDFSTKTASHGQKLRLFNRGHREESPIIALLKLAGFTFEPRPIGPDGFPTQHTMGWFANGHFGGSGDEICYLPAKFNVPHKVLLEVKTSNTTEFRKLKKDRLRLHRPQHWAQVCAYGYGMKIDYVLYVSIDKNTDEVYFEFLKIDHAMGKDMISKAEMIVETKIAPPRIAQSGAAIACQMCNFKPMCHYNEPLEKNCRSCKNATAVADGKWHCDHWNQLIPLDALIHGCPEHKEIGT